MSEPASTETEIEEEIQPDASQMSAFSDKRDDLLSALDMLFIYGNASGRNKFREKWPDVAAYIYGEQLVAFDDNGTTDFDLRKQLEEEADARRFFLKETIEDMVEKSVDSGTLQFDYVGKVVDAFGPLISVFLYSETVIERVRPGVLAGAKTPDAHAVHADVDEGISAAEKKVLTARDDQASPEENAQEPKDDFDAVQPIDTSAPEENFSNDLISPQGPADDMQNVARLSEDAASDLLPEESKSEDPIAVESGSNPAPPIHEPLTQDTEDDQFTAEAAPVADPVASNPAPPIDQVDEVAGQDSNPAPEADVSVSNPAPPVDQVGEIETQGSNPAPALGEPLVPPKRENAPVEEESVDSAVQAEVVSETAVADAGSNPAPSVDEALSVDVSEPDAGLPEESSEAPQPQPDAELPQQEAPQAEESQSPKQPEDTTEEQSAESKIDTVSFAGRE